MLRWCLWILGWALLGSPMAWADEEDQRIQAVERASRSVVSVRTYRSGAAQPGIGSGVIVRADGHIVTNAHVVKGGKVVKVTLPGGKVFTARVVRSLPERDLALLKIEAGGLTAARLGDSERVRLGQTVIAIGDPLGFTGTVTIGAVGGLGRDVDTKGIRYRDLIQTDAAINPGSSGGALVNLNGEVVGINALVYTGPPSGYDKAQGLGFAIPIKEVKALIGGLGEGAPEPPARAWLGVTGETLTRDKARDFGLKAQVGVLVTRVTGGSPAETAGVRVGDAITGLDDQDTPNVPALVGQLKSRKPGDSVTLTVWRGERRLTLVTVLDRVSQVPGRSSSTSSTPSS